MRRRWGYKGIAGLVVLGLASASCGMIIGIDKDYRPFVDEGSGGGGSSSSVGGTPTGSSTSGVGTSSAAASSSSGLPPCDTPCDCDGDGELSWECDGGDCADYDKRANTKANFLPENMPIALPRKINTPDFDFNCNGKQEVESGVVGCASIIGLGCQGSGFAKATACGQQEEFIKCGPVGVTLCTQQPNPFTTFQRCR